MKQEKPIVLLCTDGDSTHAVYNALRENFGEITVIMENSVSRRQMLERRMKKLGVVPVAGQVLFLLAVVPVLRRLSKRRVAEIKNEYKMREGLPENVIHVPSVNSEEARQKLREIDPRVVVVNGTRIINRETLNCVNARFINMHAGITPLYRGVHGAYWALAEDKPDLVGTTVHFVDEGIDTGKIIEQVYFNVSKWDNFTTYPHLHTGAGIPALIRAVRNVLSNVIVQQQENKNLSSKLRYHPTIWEYLYHRLIRRVH
jgi:folate-dependent phosphoribosylglycinamide formyltransferase PurN